MRKTRTTNAKTLRSVNTKYLHQLVASGHSVEGFAYMTTDVGTDFGCKFTYQDVVGELARRNDRTMAKLLKAHERAQLGHQRLTDGHRCTRCNVKYEPSTANFSLCSDGSRPWKAKDAPRSRCKVCRAAIVRAYRGGVPF